MSNSGCVSLRLPFGVTVGGSAIANPTLTFDPMRGLLGQFAGVLGPYMAIFKIVGFAKDILDAVTAIPDCITQVNPKPLIDKLVKVTQDIDQLLGVLPPVSVPAMIQDLLGALITYLQGLKSQIAGLQAATQVTASLEARASSLISTYPAAAGELTQIVQAAIGDTLGMVSALDAQQCAFNELIGTIIILCGLLGLKPPPLLPCFGAASVTTAVDLLSELSIVVDALDAMIVLLTALGQALGGATMPEIPC
jgi:hypothetical protein